MPSPSKTYSYFYELIRNSDGSFTISGISRGAVTVQDTIPDTNDADDKLGDAAFSDNFQATSGVATLTYQYIGRTVANDGFVAFSNPTYSLFTDTSYPANTAITTNNSQSTPICYVVGTLIRTESGDVAVEALAVGDHVITASGMKRPIRWLGHRTMTCRGRKDALPVRIAAHAFGEGRPARDLLVSPAHAVAVDMLGEVLIPVVRLINGTTIAQLDVETVTYWHVELDSHDILVAEGLPTESYLDCGNRRFFTNAGVIDILAGPDARPDGEWPFCRPLHEDGPLVDLVRARLQERAEALGWRKRDDTFAGLHLVADGVAIRPDIDGLTARFVLSAEARDVRLVCATSVPAHVLPGSTDDRRLGVALAALALDDGLTGARAVALDDPHLEAGFHPAEAGTRWTDGSARLLADLWAGCRGTVFLRVTLAGPALPRWVGPVDHAEVRRRA